MWNNTGSVAVTVALILTLLLGVMAFSMDTGYLYLKKNQYQNAVEAAAMAGAANLCEENPEDAAREIAIENIPGLESELEKGAAALTIQTGFYDENDVYGDFSTYKDFVASNDSAFPSGEYNNAVMVSLSVENSGLTGMLPLPKDSDESTVTIRAAAVAYLRAYGMLSLGEENGDGIFFSEYADNQPQIENGHIHANNNIIFESTPDIDSGSVAVTAAGSISGYSHGSYVNEAYLKPVSAYLDELYTRADVILTEADFPSITNQEVTDAYGNVLTRTYVFTPPTFQPHTGDHGGIIYFFDDDVNVQLMNNNESESEITNFIFAARGNIMWRIGNSDHHWGGENGKSVTIVSGEDIVWGGTTDYTSQYYVQYYQLYSDSNFNPKGVVFLAENNIYIRNTSSHGISDYIRYVRMIADGSIILTGPGTSNIPDVLWNMKFGPPCPPYDVKLGRLVTP